MITNRIRDTTSVRPLSIDLYNLYGESERFGNRDEIERALCFDDILRAYQVWTQESFVWHISVD